MSTLDLPRDLYHQHKDIAYKIKMKKNLLSDFALIILKNEVF